MEAIPSSPSVAAIRAQLSACKTSPPCVVIILPPAIRRTIDSPPSFTRITGWCLKSFAVGHFKKMESVDDGMNLDTEIKAAANSCRVDDENKKGGDSYAERRRYRSTRTRSRNGQRYGKRPRRRPGRAFCSRPGWQLCVHQLRSKRATPIGDAVL